MLSLESFSPYKKRKRIIDFEVELDGKICVSISSLPKKSSGYSIIIDKEELINVCEKLKK
jgi:hypothetical protein